MFAKKKKINEIQLKNSQVRQRERKRERERNKMNNSINQENKQSVPNAASGLGQTTNEHKINLQNLSLNAQVQSSGHSGQASHGWNNLRNVFSNYDQNDPNDDSINKQLASPPPLQSVDLISQNNLLTVNFPLTKIQRQQMSTEMSYRSRDHRKSFMDRSLKQRRQSTKEQTNNSLNSISGLMTQNHKENSANNFVQSKTQESAFEVLSTNCNIHKHKKNIYSKNF